jgi:hypothetical protein
MWIFCLRSLVREYGWRFAWKVAVRRPWRTLRAFREADRLDVTGNAVEVSSGGPALPPGGPPSIVGAGFCLKPIDPPCPSGRANHDCLFLEEFTAREEAGVPAACRVCAIRVIGTQALRAGAAFYVMTSARDILDDVYAPALGGGRFPTGLFALCRYSFRPFAVGLLASGMSARLLPLEQGACRDYRTWLLADRGIKDEQTTVEPAGMAGLAGAFGAAAPARAVRFERRGNVLYPAAAGPAA